MLGNHELLDRPALGEMLENDAVEYWRIALPVPHTFRIDHRDRTALANPQAIGFGSQDAALLGKT